MNTEHTFEHSVAEERNAPLCPDCGWPMHFVRAVPRLAALPELRSFQCKACGISCTGAIEPGDGNDIAWIED